MRRGFTKAAFGILGAAAISSSAFAMGPTVSGIPDVIITDNTKDPGVVDDRGFSDPQNIYVFTEAFSLDDYVSFGAGTVNWEFRELDDALTPRTGGAQTISINGNTGSDTLPDYSSITGSGLVVDSTPLDFQNVELTPDLLSAGTAPTGTGPAPDNLPNVDTAVIELYVAAASVANETDVDVFTVYTTNNDAFADADQLSTVLTTTTGAFVPVVGLNDFEGWLIQAFGSPAATFTPNTGLVAIDGFNTAPSGTNTLNWGTLADLPGGNTTTADFFQFATWGNFNFNYSGSPAINATAETLYKIRWTLSSDPLTTAAGQSVSPQVPTLRLRAGESSVLGNGSQSEEWLPNGANSVIGNNLTKTSYFYAKDDYSSVSGQARVGLFFDGYDLANGANETIQQFSYPNGHRDYGVTLSGVEIFSADLSAGRSALGTGTVLFNQGAATVPVAAGEDAPPSDLREDFDLNDWFGRSAFTSTRVSGANASNELTGGSGSVLPITVTTGDGTNLQVVWDTLDFANANSEEVVTVPNDVLVAIDVWMSSPQGSTTNNSLPGRSGDGSATRLLMNTDTFGPTGVESVVASPPGTGAAFWDVAPVGQGRAAYLEFSASNALPINDPVSTPYALETTSKRVSLFFEPQASEVADSGVPALSFRPQIDVYSFPSIDVSTATGIASATPDADTAADYTGALNQGTININRVVITTYPSTNEGSILP